jgi:hypothetical protein
VVTRCRVLFYLLVIIGMSIQPVAANAATQAVITIDSLADDLAINGNCALREALRAATLDIPWDGCRAGRYGCRYRIGLTRSAVSHQP